MTHGQPGVDTADVVVVGGGIEGTATAWALTRRGVRDVLVVERFTLGSGGTGKSSGVVRCHYGVPSLAAMAWRGVALFESAADEFGDVGFGADSGGVGFEQVGYVVGVGTGDVEALQANVATQRALGIDVSVVRAADVADLWPVADLSEFAAFAYEPRGGYGDAYLTCQAYAAAAKSGGARIRQAAPVVAVTTAGQGDARRVAGVELADGSLVSAPVVVLAAGVWSAALAAPLGVDLPLRAQREQILLVHPGDRAPLPSSGVPVFSDLVGLQYVRPERSGHLLVGNSDHSEPEWADPDAYSDVAEPEFVERAAAKFTALFPGLPNAALSSSYAGCYDVTPDYNPIISLTPVDGLVVAAGFSGHGFKISAAVGELVADLVVDGRSSKPQVPETDFRLSRYAEDAPLLSPRPYLGAGQMR